MNFKPQAKSLLLPLGLYSSDNSNFISFQITLSQHLLGSSQWFGRIQLSPCQFWIHFLYWFSWSFHYFHRIFPQLSCLFPKFSWFIYNFPYLSSSYISIFTHFRPFVSSVDLYLLLPSNGFLVCLKKILSDFISWILIFL